MWFISTTTAYKPLATSEDAEDPELTQTRVHTRRYKNLAFHCLAIAAVMYAIFSGVKYIARAMPKMRTGAPCHGPRRNLSSLPEHYTLPSGDKIPSVALGTVTLFSTPRYLY